MVSNWISTGAIGACIGALCYVITAFSNKPLHLTTALCTGILLAMSFHAIYDGLKVLGL